LTHLPELLSGFTSARLTSAPTYWRCEPGWSWHARPLTDHLLWYVLDGVGELTLHGRRRELTPGTAVVFTPGDEPVAGHDPRRRLLIFGMHFEVDAGAGPAPAGIGPAGAHRGPAEAPPPGGWCQVRDQVLVSALARRCDASYRRGDALGARQSQLCLEQLLMLVLEDSVSPPPGPVDQALEEITLAIRQDPTRRWSVPELAERAALSRAQFTRRFIAQVGTSPARYLIQARIDRAHQLLTETTMSVTQVAATLGYTDIAYFSRQYKRHTGHSPRRARGGGRSQGVNQERSSLGPR
jgi:AraC family transcriptional regulator of arabinose operon